MVRKVLVEAVDDVPRPIIAINNDWSDEQVIAAHQHRRAQLISAASGVIVLSTPQGTWAVPPRQGAWIPAGVEHQVRLIGDVSIQSLYLEPELARSLPQRCQVVGITPFLKILIGEALELPVDYDLESRGGAIMKLLQYELQALPTLPLSVPYPAHKGLADRCRGFLAKPTISETIDDWCAPLGISRRSFTRLFRQETGLSFVDWRQQACVLIALARLEGGEPVTSVALDLGYDNPAAFTTMFKRVLGAAPRSYLRQGAGAA